MQHLSIRNELIKTVHLDMMHQRYIIHDQTMQLKLIQLKKWENEKLIFQNVYKYQLQHNHDFRFIIICRGIVCTFNEGNVKI